MDKKQFKITINAPKEKVWEVLWGETSYPEWTSAFSPSSTVKTNWEKGSKVLFLDGEGRGMVSTIAEKIPNEFMSFRHLGEVSNGVEDTTSERVQAWAGSMENYTLKGTNGTTELVVDVDVSKDFEEFMSTAFPKALDKVKELAEKK